MSKNPYLTEEDKQQIVNLWMNYDCTAKAAADRLGIGYSTARKIINEYTMRGAHTPPEGMLPHAEKPERKSQINEEFDNAVNQMIAESDKPEPVAMNTAKIPEAVLDAVTAQISHLENIVACNLDEIRTLQRENEEYRTKIANMRTWLAEVDT